MQGMTFQAEGATEVSVTCSAGDRGGSTTDRCGAIAVLSTLSGRMCCHWPTPLSVLRELFHLTPTSLPVPRSPYSTDTVDPHILDSIVADLLTC